tara:strand:- start:337 stop:573 length:237 start_codon:yes stop_codon:yes gene_type:complete
MLITKEFEIKVETEYAHAEEEVLSEPERKLHVMALCMRDALKHIKQGNYKNAYLEMLCVDDWAKRVKEIVRKLSEEEE